MSLTDSTVISTHSEDRKKIIEHMEEESLQQPSSNLSLATKKQRLGICVVAVLFLMMVIGIAALAISVQNLNKKLEEKVQTSPTPARLTEEEIGPEELKEDIEDTRARQIANLGMTAVREDNRLQDCFESSFKRSFPNIGYSMLGYDIHKAFPLADSHDPGFTKPIFKAAYSQKRQSADCRFSVPNGLFFISDVSCETSFLSKVIENEKQLEQSFSKVVDFSIAYGLFSFQSSVGFKKMSSSITNEKSVFVITSAHCDYYFVKLLKETTPEFDDIFLIWMNKLQTTDLNETYIEFMDTFGTHFINEATFGARYTKEYKMTSDYYEATKSSATSVSQRASYSGMVDVGMGFSLDTEKRAKASEFTNNVETRTVTVGAAPPANGDAMTWASTVQENPVPIRYVLEPIENLFNDEYVGKLGIDFEMIRSNIIRNKENYKEYREENSDPFHHNLHENQIVTFPVKMTLFVKGGGYQGRWGESERCPPGQFAIGYNLKIQAYKKGDNTALNAVKLICADIHGGITGKEITSTEAKWGTYRKENAICPRTQRKPYFLTRFSLQIGDYTGIAATFVNFMCRDLQHTDKDIPLELFPGRGEPFGREDLWFTSESCPVGTAICGIKTKVEKKQSDGNDSALNDVKFYCCGIDTVST